MERLVSGILAFSEWFSDIICRSDTLPPLEEEHEIAAFGKPGEKDVKRMQMAIFGREPVVGRKWIVFVHLYDDTVMAFENVFKKEEKKGRTLVAPRAGLFVVNTDEDIRIELNALEPGWEIKESNLKIIKSTDAWNPPENATDFPSCCFEICHVDETKQSFSCTVSASHGTETSKQKIMAVFKQEKENNYKTDGNEATKDGEVTNGFTTPNEPAIPIGNNRSKILEVLSGAEMEMGIVHHLATFLELRQAGASHDWRRLAESLSLKTWENIRENGVNPTSDMFKIWTITCTLKLLESYWESSKKDILNMLMTNEGCLDVVTNLYDKSSETPRKLLGIL